jgi:hypothetical protein
MGNWNSNNTFVDLGRITPEIDVILQAGDISYAGAWCMRWASSRARKLPLPVRPYSGCIVPGSTGVHPQGVQSWAVAACTPLEWRWRSDACDPRPHHFGNAHTAHPSPLQSMNCLSHGTHIAPTMHELSIASRTVCPFCRRRLPARPSRVRVRGRLEHVYAAHQRGVHHLEAAHGVFAESWQPWPGLQSRGLREHLRAVASIARTPRVPEQ